MNRAFDCNSNGGCTALANAETATAHGQPEAVVEGFHGVVELDDPASGARYIYTGAAINVSMYAHSFTLVQPLGPAPSASLAPPVATAAVET